uniref:Uncharacterized protein n=1 Tax=Branchiostoma floridae TaxID=7739 RepID=C3ZL22_BRAFL|eukprot:XP_002590693.1 hypothetical protein BRAFLDRAFT_89495 [Branchiostoma floridae]
MTGAVGFVIGCLTVSPFRGTGVSDVITFICRRQTDSHSVQQRGRPSELVNNIMGESNCFQQLTVCSARYPVFFGMTDSVAYVTLLSNVSSAMGNCAGGQKSCNCDKNDLVWRSDEGMIRDIEALPVTRLHFGDTGDYGGGSTEKGFFTLGPLRCRA